MGYESTDEDGLELETVDDEKILGEIKNPFDPSKIRISRKITPISAIVLRIQHNEIDLSPDFQRKARIWDNVRKSRLIESILLRIPLPVFYVASDDEENWRVVDGLQRITTIYDFIDGDNDNRFSLSALEYLDQFNGLEYNYLPRSIQRRISETELNINIIESGTPENVMFNIFRRLNTGGISLNSQEIRNALHPGPVRKFLINLSSLKSFILATDGGVNDNRMSARELALRFCAFYPDYINDYSDDLDSFLNEAMRRLNDYSKSERESLADKFQSAMDRSYRVFGHNAFRKIGNNSSRRPPVNRALFEAIAVNISSLSEKQFDVLEKNKNNVQKDLKNWIDDNSLSWSVTASTGSRLAVLTRFGSIEKIFKANI